MELVVGGAAVEKLELNDGSSCWTCSSPPVTRWTYFKWEINDYL